MKNMTVREALDLASKKTNHIEANTLLQYILNVDKKYIIVNSNSPINQSQEELLMKSLCELENGIPLQYITSKAYFMGLEFYVDKNVLIPQPDTEILVEEALKIINASNKKLRILDLCTGSGAIAVSIAKYAKNVEIIGSDISKEALDIAKINYKKLIKLDNGVLKNKNVIKSRGNDNLINSNNEASSNKIKFIVSDMFDKIKGRFDLIISNPPYIKTEVIKQLSKDVQNEPKIALDGGEDGLRFYKIIRDNIESFLAKDGTLLMEIGYDQKKEVQSLFEHSKCIKDLSGNDRVIIWRK